MDLMDLLKQADGGNSVDQLAGAVGIPGSKAQDLIGALSPALVRSLQKQAQSRGGLEALQDALATGSHARYVEQPELLASAATRDDGNKILGHLFGSKDVSRQVAANASQSTGIDVSIIKKFLPLAAAAAMGAMSKETAAGSNLSQQGAGGGMLGKLLDSDGDGSVMDDLLSLGKRFL